MRQFFLFILLLLYCSDGSAAAPAVKVVVPIAPYAYFVKRIGAPHVEVITVVPSSASSHSYEPTARQILLAADALLWFTLGENFESRAIKAAKYYHPSLLVEDLKSGTELIVANNNEASCCHCSNIDPHIWLSPIQAKKQVALIAKALIQLDPSHKEEFEKNLALLLADLDKLDRDSRSAVDKLCSKTFVVSHPSYSYFARDYHLNQLSIEVEGKDPSAKQLIELVEKAKKAKTKIIFVQPQHSIKGAQQIARLLQADLFTLDPYAEEYFASMYSFLEALSNQDKVE